MKVRDRDGAPEPVLAGADKVTVLLLTMGKVSADAIIRDLEAGEIKAIARAASLLPAISPGTISGLIAELEAALQVSDVVKGSSREAEQLISGAVSDELAAEIMSELRGTSHERVWPKLAAVPDEKLAAFVAKEQPQVASFILSRLEVAKASQVLSKLDVALASELSRRLLSLKAIGEDVEKLVAERLALELLVEKDEGKKQNRHAQLGAILNQMGRPQVQQILGDIEQHGSDDAQRVKDHVFGFEDIPQMARDDRVRLMEEVAAEKLVMALRGAEPELRASVLDALSQRSRRMVEAELSTPVKPAPKSIADARRSIATLALDMAARSMISLRPAAADATPEAAG